MESVACDQYRCSWSATDIAYLHCALLIISDEPYNFSVTFRQAENYPVDLYFLMDVSNTMKEFKDTLQHMSYILGQ